MEYFYDKREQFYIKKDINGNGQITLAERLREYFLFQRLF